MLGMFHTSEASSYACMGKEQLMMQIHLSSSDVCGPMLSL